VIAEAAKLVMEPKPAYHHGAQVHDKSAAPAHVASSHLVGQLADLLATHIMEEPQPKDSRMVVESKLWREEQERKQAQGIRLG